jgi:hypothetical protein
MSNFRQWVSTREGKEAAYFFSVPPEVKPHLDSILTGKRLRRVAGAFNIHIEAPFIGRLTDDLTVLNHHLLLVTPRLVKTIEECGVDGLATYPCIVTVGEGSRYAAEYLLVVLRDIVYCVDHDKSELELDVEDPRNIQMVNSLAIDEGRLAGSLLFRLGESPRIVIVHESVAKAVTSANITGVRFAPVDGSVELPDSLDQVGGEWPDSLLEYSQKNLSDS